MKCGASSVLQDCVPHKCTKYNEETGCVLWRLRNGIYVRIFFPYKAGSTEWLRLLVLHVTGCLIRDPHWPVWVSVRGMQPYSPQHVASSGGQLMRILITRSPYERMLSAYLDKVVTHGKLGLAPRGVQRNSTFAEFVRLASTERRPRTRSAAEHYGPLTTWWCENPKWCDGCWLGFHNDTRILKLEEIDLWYAEIVHALGWEAEVRDSRWASGCFYRPVDSDCSTALESRRSDAASGPHHLHPCRAHGAQYGRHGGHQHKTCSLMAKHYTPQVARIVTVYSWNDLVRFGYPVWHGDIDARPTIPSLASPEA